MDSFSVKSDIKPINIGVRVKSPAIVLFYQDASKTLHRRTMPIRGLRANSVVHQFVQELTDRHKKQLQCVPSYKIEKMIRLLQETMRGKSVDDALSVVEKEFEIDPEENLNILDDETLKRKKEIMSETFEKNRKKPGDPDFQYNIEVDFSQVEKEKSEWDTEDEKDL